MESQARMDLDNSSDRKGMLELLKDGAEATISTRAGKDLPELASGILASYEEDGIIDHLEGKDLPSKDSVLRALNDLLTILFPGYLGRTMITESNIKPYTYRTLGTVYELLVGEVDRSLRYICLSELKCSTDVCRQRAETIVTGLLEDVPKIRELLKGDVQAAYDGDPAARNMVEIILSYPCVLAITTYRIAHELHTRGVPMVPRMMSEYAHSLTGIDIHPGAEIGKNFFIDHGTGVVIGETTEIGDNVRIYQGVTLGALSVPKGGAIRGKKRHPTIEDDVIIYSGATILGGHTVIGRGSVIGGNTWITSSIPPETTVTFSPPKLVCRNSLGTKSEKRFFTHSAIVNHPLPNSRAQDFTPSIQGRLAR